MKLLSTNTLNGFYSIRSSHQVNTYCSSTMTECTQFEDENMKHSHATRNNDKNKRWNVQIDAVENLVKETIMKRTKTSDNAIEPTNTWFDEEDNGIRHVSSSFSQCSAPNSKNDEVSMSSADSSKLAAARKCVQAEVRSGMRLGIGSGSTVRLLIDILKEVYSSGQLENVQCVPTSYQTREWLREANLPVQSVDVLHDLDLTIDGADEVDASLTCVKGGGGCLLQEKLVQLCAKRFVILGTKEKYVSRIGTHYKSIPIEVVPYGWSPVKKWITERVGGQCVLRMDQKKCFPTITENHNYIFDWYFPIDKEHNWIEVHQTLIHITGVVETGLFINVADAAYFGDANGDVLFVENKNKLA